MSQSNRLWVLGHKIRPIRTDDSYGLVEVVSPPKVPRPPPHFHKSECEFFFIIKGSLDVMANGKWQHAEAGTFIELPPGTAHTFINNGEEETVWLTGWRPKGFQQFFEDFGVPVEEDDAAARSVSEPIIRNVVNKVENYGMYLAKE